jgi:hypothetical protein
MLEPRSASAGRDGEAALDEHAVERCHARLSLRVDGGERDVLRPLQVTHDLAGVQPPLRLDDRREVRVGAREGAVEQRLELAELFVGLEQRYVIGCGELSGSTAPTIQRIGKKKPTMKNTGCPRCPDLIPQVSRSTA